MGSKNKHSKRKSGQKPGNLEVFLANLKEIYPTIFLTVEKGLRNNRNTTFRFVRSKEFEEKAREDLKNLGYQIKAGPIENSYEIIKEPKKSYISDTESFKNGWIYVQEFASMAPPTLLELDEQESLGRPLKILDMAAAPGSKTSQIADLTNYQSEILALEKHPIRIQKLKHNLGIYKCDNVQAFMANGIKFDKRNPQFVEFFDRVLVDAPCSSEGRFNLNDPKTYKYWNIKKRREMSKAQKGLLMSGIRMLKPGGVLVYSTCTFGTEENEEVLQWLLEKIPELEIEKVEMPFKNIHAGLTTIYKENKHLILNKQIKNSIRVLPNEQFGGFFIAKIKKPEDFKLDLNQAEK
jgi:16S rRNA C967 or C1407 C5-methylase (RsmB/RsmF family)